MRAMLHGLSSRCSSSLGPALADDAADIRARLEQWTEDFNAKRVEPVCDLFSKELLSTVRGQGDKDYAHPLRHPDQVAQRPGARATTTSSTSTRSSSRATLPWRG